MRKRRAIHYIDTGGVIVPAEWMAPDLYALCVKYECTFKVIFRRLKV